MRTGRAGWIAFYALMGGLVIYGLTLGPILFGYAAFVAAPVLGVLIPVIYVVGFLSLIGGGAFVVVTGKLPAFRDWLDQKLEILKDRVSPVTTSARMVAEQFGDAEDKGFLLTMAPGRRTKKNKAPKKLTYVDDRHITLIAGSRAGKGRSIILPNLAHWKGSVIAFDPAGELVHESAAFRETELDQDIRVLDPFGVTDRESAAWNPFDEIDAGDPFIVDKARLIAESLVPPTSQSDSYWTDAARGLLTSLILQTLTAAPQEERNLITVRTLLCQSDMGAVWALMQENDALGGLVAQMGAENDSREGKELAGALQTARVATDWLDAPAMRDLIAASQFALTDIKAGRVSVYLVLPPGRGASYARWLRLFFNMAFDAMQDPSIVRPEHDVLFVLDEFPLLGRMERIEQAAGEAAKFGVKLLIAAQDITQLKKHYGESWESFVANSGLLIMFANNDLPSQGYISKRLGKSWVTRISETFAKGGGSTTKTQELQDVARTEEVARQGAREGGEAYFFRAGAKPWRLKRANYDAWGMLGHEQLVVSEALAKTETVAFPRVA